MGDTQVWLEISRRAKVKYLPEQLATRNDLPESACRSRDPRRMLRFVLSVKDLHEHYLQKYDCPADLARTIRLKFTRSALYYAGQALDREEARRQFAALRVMQCRPAVRDRLYYFGSWSRPMRFAARLALRVAEVADCLRSWKMPPSGAVAD
jgi:hypothetical protein